MAGAPQQARRDDAVYGPCKSRVVTVSRLVTMMGMLLNRLAPPGAASARRMATSDGS